MCNHAAAIQPQHKRHTENNLACDSMCMRNAPDSTQILASPEPRTCDRLRSSIIHSALRTPDIHITGMSEPSCMRNKIRQTQMTAQTNKSSPPLIALFGLACPRPLRRLVLDAHLFPGSSGGLVRERRRGRALSRGRERGRKRGS